MGAKRSEGSPEQGVSINSMMVPGFGQKKSCWTRTILGIWGIEGMYSGAVRHHIQNMRYKYRLQKPRKGNVILMVCGLCAGDCFDGKDL